MSIGKQRHVCARCGNEWTERTHAYYEEMQEWIQHEGDIRAELARAYLKISHLEHALETEQTLSRNFQAIAERWQRMYEEEETLAF